MVTNVGTPHPQTPQSAAMKFTTQSPLQAPLSYLVGGTDLGAYADLVQPGAAPAAPHATAAPLGHGTPAATVPGVPAAPAHPHPPAAPGAAPAPAQGHGGGAAAAPAHAAGAKHGPRAHKKIMSRRPDERNYSANEVHEAKALVRRSKAATTRYRNVKNATADGFVLSKPKKGKRILHAKNKANLVDGKVLDPNKPESLLYERLKGGKLKLVGVMYSANRSEAAPTVGGGIGMFHHHNPKLEVTSGGGMGGMMHVWFNDDVSDAYMQTQPQNPKKKKQQPKKA